MKEQLITVVVGGGHKDTQDTVSVMVPLPPMDRETAHELLERLKAGVRAELKNIAELNEAANG